MGGRTEKMGVGVKGKTAAVALVAAGALALSGCTDDKPLGPAGTVKAKDMRSWTTGTGTSKVRHWDYDLTVTTPDGKDVKFEVSSKHYKRCHNGSAYPSCTKREDRD